MAEQAGVTVVLRDGRKITVNVSSPLPADLVAFEAKFDVSADVLNGDHNRVTWSMFIIWRMIRRVDPVLMPVTFEDFIELVDDIQETTVDAMDPTGEALPTA